MKKRLVILPAILVLALSAANFLQDSTALASSDFSETGTLAFSDYNAGTCSVFTGPRTITEGGGSLLPNEFLLKIDSDGVVLKLRGQFVKGGAGALELSPNLNMAEDSYEAILRAQSGDSNISFRLDFLQASARLVPVASGQTQAVCDVFLSGRVTTQAFGTVPSGLPADPALGLGFMISNQVTVRYKGTGTYYAGVDSIPPSSLVSADGAACSDPTNLKPDPQSCSGTNCLLDFAGFKWWTYNQFYPGGSGFWNNNNSWSPRNETVQGDGLHLFVRPDNLGHGTRYMAAELVLLQNADGSPARLGFGTYLVTAKLLSGASWDTMDPNVAFGVFTYEKEETGTTDNPNREIDLAEVSRWGNRASQPCEDKRPRLCVGNAQFTLQKSDALPDDLNVERYSINPGVNEITLVMIWKGAGQPVEFEQYDGNFDLSSLPATPNNHWKTDATSQNRFIPGSNCQRFLLNFWMGKYRAAVDGYNPPPASPQELVVERFQFSPQ